MCNSTGLVYVVCCCQRTTARVCRWLLMTTTVLVLVTKVPRQSNWNTTKEATMIKVKEFIAFTPVCVLLYLFPYIHINFSSYFYESGPLDPWSIDAYNSCLACLVIDKSV